MNSNANAGGWVSRLVPDNPANRPEIPGDRVTLVEKWGVQDGGRNEQCIHSWIVLSIGCDRGHGPPKSDLIMLHVELGSSAGPAGRKCIP